MHKAPLMLGLMVALRVAGALILVFHPSFNEPAELEGWDIARFQEIADSDGRPYLDYEVEYPPGSVLAISVISSLDDGPGRVVTAHRVLVVFALFVDLSIAFLLNKSRGRSVSMTYLLLGTPLIFFGLVRLDLLAVIFAVMTAMALSRTIGPASPGSSSLDRLNPTSDQSRSTTGGSFIDALGAIAIIAGALVKIWPAVLILGAIALGRRRMAMMASIGGLFGFLVWIAISGVEAPQQVLSLRGAVGWHVESTGGSMTALLSGEPSALEADAYRIGTMNSTIVGLSRAAAGATMVGLAWLGSRSRNGQRLALVTLSCVAAMIVSAPLLSPQFLLWLTPWAAMLYSPRQGSEDTRQPDPNSPALFLTAATIAITVLVHVIVGPASLHHTVPALLLLVRNGLLLALVIACALALHRTKEPPRA